MAFALARGLATSLLLSAVLLDVSLAMSGEDSWSLRGKPGGGPTSQESLEEDDSVFAPPAQETLGGLLHVNSPLRTPTRLDDVMVPSPPKRSTMLLNKLMQPLLKAFKAEPEVSYSPQMELRRRGEGKMFWRCYFNAVSCFRRRK